jgi:photosystem II stability/assembly factor-like uncharacterized protein
LLLFIQLPNEVSRRHVRNMAEHRTAHALAVHGAGLVVPQNRTRLAAVVIALVCVGVGGYITHSRLQPRTGSWQLVLDRPIAGKYEDFAFVDEQTGWASTAIGEILRTDDGGLSWAVQAESLGVVRSIDFLDRNRGFAGTLSGRLYATENGGRIWTDISSRLPRAAKGFCGLTHIGNSLHAVGRYFGGTTDYFSSEDGGQTWRYDNLAEHAQALVDISFVSDSIGYIGGMSRSSRPDWGRAIILKTTDRGMTWKPVYLNEAGREFVWKLWPLTDRTIVAAIQSQDGVYRIARTDDGGDTWRTLTVATGQPIGIGIQGVAFLDTLNGWVGGFFRGMYQTRDGGLTWTKVDVPGTLINRFAVTGKFIFTGSTRGILRFEAK